MNNRHFFFSQFRRLKVQDQGANTAEFSSWLADGHQMVEMSSCGGERALVSLPLLIRTLIPSWGPHPHLNLIPSQRSPPLNTITLGVRASAMNGGGYNSVHNTLVDLKFPHDTHEFTHSFRNCFWHFNYPHPSFLSLSSKQHWTMGAAHFTSFSHNNESLYESGIWGILLLTHWVKTEKIFLVKRALCLFRRNIFMSFLG